jgi:UDP-N-acetylmuramyl pentapeptide phosphotransferase/UDP-N-acetylglucosamine-1-phosphate transferase
MVIADELTISVIKVLGAAGASFALAMTLTPLATRIMYACKLWKATSGKHALAGGTATIFNRLHNEADTPRVGGIIIWVSVLLVMLLFWRLDTFNFLSRSQTWLLAFTLAAASLLRMIFFKS